MPSAPSSHLQTAYPRGEVDAVTDDQKLFNPQARLLEYGDDYISGTVHIGEWLSEKQPSSLTICITILKIGKKWFSEGNGAPGSYRIDYTEADIMPIHAVSRTRIAKPNSTDIQKSYLT